MRVGIVGPSWWVNFWHLPALQNHPDAQIVAVCGTKPRDSTDVAAKYGPDVTAYTDLNAMLTREALDGVIVCTPNDVHYPASLAALEAGLHVLCEKPLTMHAGEARHLADEATRRGLLGMCNFPYRANPCAQALRQRVAEGYVGTLLHVAAAYHGGFGLNGPPGWRGWLPHSSAGILGDLGSHLIDLVRFTTGQEFRSVCSHALTVTRDKETDAFSGVTRMGSEAAGERNDDSCAFLAEFESGAQGVLHTSWLIKQGRYGQHQEIEVVGTQGRLQFVSNHVGTRLRGLREQAKEWETFAIADTVAYESCDDDNEDYFRPGRLTPTNTTYRWVEGMARGKRGDSRFHRWLAHAAGN